MRSNHRLERARRREGLCAAGAGRLMCAHGADQAAVAGRSSSSLDVGGCEAHRT